jgi:hypothetical protein
MIPSTRKFYAQRNVSRSRLYFVDMAGRALVVATVLNINGVFTMAFGIGQAASILLLGISLILVFRAGKLALSGLMLTFIATITTYLGTAALYTDGAGALETIGRYAQTYGGTIIITWAVAATYVRAARQGQGMPFLHFVRDAFVVSAAAVWASPFLYAIYINPPLSMGFRMAGFFSDPNEAGAAAAVALAIVIGLPYPRHLITYSAIIICIGAILLTFSKTAIIAGIVIIAVHAIRQLRGPSLILVPLLAVFMFFTVQEARELSKSIASQNIIELSTQQQIRVQQIGLLLSGQIDDEITTGRSRLWDRSLELILRDLPGGSGLGSFHHLDGYQSSNGVFQGAHNLHLMIWGEGGFFAGIAFLMFVTIFIIQIALRSTFRFEWLWLVIFLIFSFSFHNLLGLRFISVVLGILIGILAVSRTRLRKRVGGLARLSYSASRITSHTPDSAQRRD